MAILIGSMDFRPIFLNGDYKGLLFFFKKGLSMSTRWKELTTVIVSALIFVTICITLIEINTSTKINGLEEKHQKEVKALTEERDMYKKRWEFRDDVATYYYDEYLDLKEKYENLKLALGKTEDEGNDGTQNSSGN